MYYDENGYIEINGEKYPIVITNDSNDVVDASKNSEKKEK